MSTQANDIVATYIANAAEFARPILSRFSDIVTTTCPSAEPALKWGMPMWLYQGKILCGMSAFKAHASFGFWQHEAVMGEGAARTGMGSYGKITSVKDMPPKATLVRDLKKAMALIEAGVKPVKKAVPRAAPDMPADLPAALAKHKAAAGHFKAFPPGAQREYIDWITEAKREETRLKRLTQAVEWIGEGKRRNWKYEGC